MTFRRRDFVKSLAAAAGTLSTASGLLSQDAPPRGRDYAMLMGSLIGDALGGPVEFLAREESRAVLPDSRSWNPDRMLDQPTLAELAESIEMNSYVDLRPDPAPYGPWKSNAARGTITDDSRHKIVVMRALRKMLVEGRNRITQADLARAFVDFRPHENREPRGELATLVEAGLREYRYASRWILGERDNALPVQRLWSGISNCSGQMALLPMAALFAGEPDRAYRETFAIDFIDAPIARDICSALNASLAAALDPALDGATIDRRWQALLEALRTDPFAMAKVPFAGRPLDRWLDLADSIVQRANGRPATLFDLLEREGKPVYYWDAHFTLLVPLTILKACRMNPMAAMHLTLDFGHDSDSYAQVLGAMVGAVHGMDIFPVSMSSAVRAQLRADYGESVDQWTATLRKAARSWPDPSVDDVIQR